MRILQLVRVGDLESRKRGSNGSSDDSCTEDSHHHDFKHHFAHLAFKDDVFLGFNSERKTNTIYDGGWMPNYGYPGSESSENDKSK